MRHFRSPNALLCPFQQSQFSKMQVQAKPLSITRKPTKTGRIDCKVSGINFRDAYIHWYRHRPGEAPEWILYFKTQTEKSNFDKEKFSVDKTTEKSTLTVNKLTYNDMATYYCAYWDRTVLETKLDSTKIQALPPSTEQDGKVSYMCLIEDFYPNVIKVTWEEENKNAEKNGVHEEIWPPGDNQQSYSLSSWLTVDKNSNKNYRCKYEHEIKGDYVPMESPVGAEYPPAPANQLFGGPSQSTAWGQVGGIGGGSGAGGEEVE
uniref:Ig-like domain-containing protein n=1 Tax=Gopherus agassizii TaxID=38772 RepID=A0A452IHY4_9SAUR